MEHARGQGNEQHGRKVGLNRDFFLKMTRDPATTLD
jgi:hypothetical protein